MPPPPHKKVACHTPSEKMVSFLYAIPLLKGYNGQLLIFAPECIIYCKIAGYNSYICKI